MCACTRALGVFVCGVVVVVVVEGMGGLVNPSPRGVRPSPPPPPPHFPPSCGSNVAFPVRGALEDVYQTHGYAHNVSEAACLAVRNGSTDICSGTT